MRRPAALLVAGVVLTVAAAACGGSDEVRTPSSERTPTTEQAGSSAKAYVGLTKEAAIARADAADVPWRILREDDEEFLATQDYVPERVNFEIDDGTVTKATYG